MSIIHVTGTGGRVTADRTLFVGPSVPHEIKAMIKPLAKIDKQAFRKLLQGTSTHQQQQQYHHTVLLRPQVKALRQRRALGAFVSRCPSAPRCLKSPLK